jgi:hypothetical protein
MSKKTVPFMIAALALAVSASSTFAANAKHRGREHVRVQHAFPYNARASALDNLPSWVVYGAHEPFTVGQKRAFQTPTGHEVDRW